MTMTESLPARVSRVTQIDDKIDRDAVGAMAVSSQIGGMQFKTMMEVMEFAKLMAVSDVAVPKHLRCNPGACLAVCINALEWRMSPYAVANKSYVVNDRIAYESQLIHAVIEQRAPLAGRMRNRYVGEGGKRRCIVTAKIKGEDEPFEFQSPEFDQITPKNSPLWKSKPDLQLFYNASRDWARMYFPDVILGVYAEDELEVAPPVVAQRGMAALEAKITKRPVSENQTFEASPEALQAAANEQQQAPELPAETQAVENGDEGGQGAEGQQAPAPATAEEVDTPEKFMDAITSAGIEHFDAPEKLQKWLDGRLIRIQKKGKLQSTTINWRQATLDNLRAGKLD